MELLTGAPLSAGDRGDRADASLARGLTSCGRCCARSVRRTRKGIVHRDLKPDNIFLVDRDDDTTS